MKNTNINRLEVIIRIRPILFTFMCVLYFKYIMDLTKVIAYCQQRKEKKSYCTIKYLLYWMGPWTEKERSIVICECKPNWQNSTYVMIQKSNDGNSFTHICIYFLVINLWS